jgi:hypothetical protein
MNSPQLLNRSDSKNGGTCSSQGINERRMISERLLEKLVVGQGRVRVWLVAGLTMGRVYVFVELMGKEYDAQMHTDMVLGESSGAEVWQRIQAPIRMAAAISAEFDLRRGWSLRRVVRNSYLK